MLNEFHDDLNDGMDTRFEQFSARLDQDARQRRYAMEADETANTKTQERTEAADEAVQEMRGDSCTAEQKVRDGPKTSITFGVEDERPDLSCKEDVSTEDGATAPKSCLLSLEMRSP